MATFVPAKVSTQFIFFASVVSQANTKIMQVNPTIAAGDFKVSIDGGALANLATLPAVTPAGSSMIKFTLSTSEMAGANATVVGIDAAGAEWCDLVVNIPTAARQIDDLAWPTTTGRSLDVTATGAAGIDWGNLENPTTANALTATSIITTQKVDVETIKTNPVVNAGTVTFPTTATLASTTNITAGTIATATNVTTVNGLAANVITAAATATDFGDEMASAIWKDTTAGDFTTALSVGKSVMNGVTLGTGLTVASVTGAVGSVTGAVGSVTGAVGSVTGAVGSVAAGGITAASIATDAIDADALAADAITEIWAKACTEPTSVIAASPTVLAAISWLATLSRNKITQTAIAQILKADDTTTTIATSTVSDDGTTATRGKFT